ncbi:MAG TPA: zf-HC2 domain-containing protein, partial [Candidatus Goldiibacteriota bacterium]|nr:zf-HC2 domain-containing protein [Candidatus Goldiibacteriota bacterium]
MEHREIANKLSAFVDNEVSEAQRAEIEHHIHQCQECRNEIDNYQLITNNLKLNSEIQVSSAFRAKVNAAIDSQKTVKSTNPVPSLWKLLPVPAGLSLVILVFSAYMLAAP